MNRIIFETVRKTFGDTTAINGLDLSIGEGEIYALLGHNGAGKTTALRLLLGLLEPDQGTVSVFGDNPMKNGNVVRGMCGVLSEDVGLYEPLTVYDNLMYYADIYGMSRVESNKRIDELLCSVDLFDKKHVIVKGFSTGMKKKVALIRSMLHRPRILLLDEPTNGLDPVSTTDLRNMLSELSKEQGATIIMTTHNLEEVQKLCDKISILRHGQNIFTNSISSLKDSQHYMDRGQFSLEKLYMDIEGKGDQMNKSVTVFHLQLALFRCEKGMLIFYLLCIMIAGVIAPILLPGLGSTLPISGLLTVLFLKSILTDSLAGERENKTLESLLSTSIDGKSIIGGKFIFSVTFGLVFFTITILCAVLTKWVMGSPLNMRAWQWACVLLLSILNFISISIAGTYASATSGDSRMAGSRVSRIVYPFGLLLIVYFSIVSLEQMIPALFAGLIIMLIYLCPAIVYAIKVLKMKQDGYFENIKIQGSKKNNSCHASSIVPKSQFSIVFRQELRKLWTLKFMLFNFLLLCFFPAIVLCIAKYYLGETNLYYAVLLTALMMPRTPTNLISYSIGGEKVYKTGEALLSTPLRVGPLFFSKSMIPVLISAIMLALSSLLTLAAANYIGMLFESGTVYLYSIDQLVLLFPVGIISCITMVIITGILSVNMKTPRQGLFASTFLGTIFVVPPLAIVFLAQNRLLWSILYFAALLLFNAVCVKVISDKITRPQIMSKL